MISSLDAIIELAEILSLIASKRVYISAFSFPLNFRLTDVYQDAIATMSQQFDIPSEKMIESEKILEDNYFG